MKQTLQLKQRMPLVAKQIVTLITTTLVLLLLLMPVLSIEGEYVADRDSKFLPISSSLVFYGEEGIVERRMSFLTLADRCFACSKSAELYLWDIDEVLDRADEADPSDDYRLSAQDRNRLKTTQMWLTTTRIAGITVGILIYVLLIGAAGAWVFNLVSIMIVLFAKTTENELKTATKLKIGSGAETLLLSYVVLLLMQFTVLGGLNYRTLSGGFGYGYKLIFVSGIHYLIAAIVIFVVVAVANSLIDKYLPIKACQNSSSKAKKD